MKKMNREPRVGGKEKSQLRTEELEKMERMMRDARDQRKWRE